MEQTLVVGLYGISGSGKSHALDVLAKSRPEWLCLEGSKVIETVLKLEGSENPMTTFSNMNAAEKGAIREKAVDYVSPQRPCACPPCVLVLSVSYTSFPTDPRLLERTGGDRRRALFLPKSNRRQDGLR
mmetsp:Transcript_3489/g.9645  ORF Transcript_3489/g.9645 Transcript_3489/m.9645 type:complete len:129 (-) Transcript_3489:1793-2179(-)